MEFGGLVPCFRNPAHEASGQNSVSRRETPALRRLVLVAASSGGPRAVLELFARMPSRVTAAVVVAQHMHERFTGSFAERLNRLSSLRVSELREKEHLASGCGFVCPGGRSVEIRASDAGPLARVVDAAEEDLYAPSADRLFATGARVLRNRVVAVVLTGMGCDGARGSYHVSRAGGLVLAQSPETAAVDGMPRAVVSAGVAHEILALDALMDRIVSLVS